MTYIQRELQAQILNETPPKAIVIFGARQIGKTTLLTELAKTESSVRWFNGDMPESQNQLRFNSATDVELTLRQADVIVIDEAQDFGMMAYFIQKGRADGVIVSNMEEVSTSLSDAYEKIGVIREAGGEIISVDQKNLAMEELEAHYEQKTRI